MTLSNGKNLKNYLKIILNKINNPNSRQERPPPRIPSGKRIYCIGDIHGRADLLLDMAKTVHEDAARFNGQKIVVFLGDYIDRGMHSKEVVTILAEASFLVEFEKVFLCGNHEQTLLDFLKGEYPVLKEWWRYGAQTTFYSYGIAIAGIPSEAKYPALQAQLQAAIPDSHLNFFQQLSRYVVVGDYCFVHAGIKPGIELAQQRDSDLFWIREEFLNSKKPHEKIIVHGHTIVSEPENWPNRIAIDTGAYLSGKLSCLVLEEDTQRMLKSVTSTR
jgi:serine/threonine protein phosphatase 1